MIKKFHVDSHCPECILGDSLPYLLVCLVLTPSVTSPAAQVSMLFNLRVWMPQVLMLFNLRVWMPQVLMLFNLGVWMPQVSMLFNLRVWIPQVLMLFNLGDAI